MDPRIEAFTERYPQETRHFASIIGNRLLRSEVSLMVAHPHLFNEFADDFALNPAQSGLTPTDLNAIMRLDSVPTGKSAIDCYVRRAALEQAFTCLVEAREF